MDRDFRNKPAGLIFITVLTIGLLFSVEGSEFIKASFVENHDIPLLSVLGIIIVLLSSDAFGYIFVSLGYFLFNSIGGYSIIFSRLIIYKDFKHKIIDYFTKNNTTHNKSGMVTNEDLKDRLTHISSEVLHVYFYWYKEGSQNPYDAWLIRRYSAFITAISVILSLLIGNVLVTCLMKLWSLTWSSINTIIAITSIFICFVMFYNGLRAITEAVQLHDLWISGKDNPQFINTYNWIHKKSLLGSESNVVQNLNHPSNKDE